MLMHVCVCVLHFISKFQDASSDCVSEFFILIFALFLFFCISLSPVLVVYFPLYCGNVPLEHNPESVHWLRKRIVLKHI